MRQHTQRLAHIVLSTTALGLLSSSLWAQDTAPANSGKPAQGEKPAAAAPAVANDPAAKKSYDAAVAAVRKLKGISFVSQMKLEMKNPADAAMIPADFGGKARFSVQFATNGKSGLGQDTIRAEIVEGGEHLRTVIDLGGRAVELHEVEPLDAEVREAAIDERGETGGGVSGRDMRREPAARLRGHDEGLGSLATEPADQPLGAAVAVDVGRVEEGDAGVERRVERCHRVRVVGAAPGPAADPPGTEAHLRHLPARPSEGSRVHGSSVRDSWLRRHRRPTIASPTTPQAVSDEGSGTDTGPAAR
jgi:hypothetical protein